ERRALLDRAELHAPADLRADVEVGGAEAVAGDVVAALHGAIERVDDVFKTSEPGHAALLGLRLEAEAPGGHRRLDRSRREEQPPIVVAAIPQRRREPG